MNKNVIVIFFCIGLLIGTKAIKTKERNSIHFALAFIVLIIGLVLIDLFIISSQIRDLQKGFTLMAKVTREIADQNRYWYHITLNDGEAMFMPPSGCTRSSVSANYGIAWRIREQ